MENKDGFTGYNRRVCYATEKCKTDILIQFLPDDDVFIVDSFPMPICDFKRAPASTSPLKCADAAGTLATYGKCVTKGLDTFLGFRASVITTAYGLPVDFAIATADTDDREVLPLFCERSTYPIIIRDKGYVSDELETELLRTNNVCLLPTRRKNEKIQYSPEFRKLHQKIRRRVETTISQLTQQFNASRIRARSHWGMLTRFSNKIGGFALGVFLNKCLGRKLMALKDVVYA